jgi:hypothetical protein
MASSNFRNLADHLAKAAINFSTASFKCLLVSSVPSEANLDSWINRSDVTNEVTGTGYTAGGVAVTATVGAVDTTNNRVPITFGNLSPGWTSATITALGAVIYLSSGTSTTDKLIQFVDFSGTVSSTNGNYSVTFTTPLYINAP